MSGKDCTVGHTTKCGWAKSDPNTCNCDCDGDNHGKLLREDVIMEEENE